MALAPRVRQISVANGPAILAEVNGGRPAPAAAALARIRQPSLLVSGESSPVAFRTVDTSLARLLPHARHEMVGSGHLVDPAHPVVLEFLDSLLR